MKLLVQLEDNKTSSDKDKICLNLNFFNTHTIYPCIPDFGLVFISPRHVPSLNFDLTLFMF